MPDKVLNNLKGIHNIDIDSMYKELDGLPQNFTDELSCPVPAEYGKAKNILIGGMGGSGISGDIIETITANSLNLPLRIVKDFYIPSFVDSSTLAVIISYSGNTEETLALLDECIKRKSKIVALSNGGELKEKASKLSIPYIKINDSLMPRTAIGNLLNPLLHLFASLFPGCINTGDIKATRNALKKLREIYTLSSPCPENRAKTYAVSIKDKRIFVLGSEKHTRAAALRWKTQINENAKLNIFFNTFPELCHNEIIGIADDPEKNRGNVIFALRSKAESQSLRRSIDVALEIMRNSGSEIFEISNDEESVLSSIMSLCYLGDWISYYLSILRNVNPTPVTCINMYKKLNKERSGK